MNKSTKILAAGLIGFSLTGGTGLALAADDNVQPMNPEVKITKDGNFKVTENGMVNTYDKDGKLLSSIPATAPTTETNEPTDAAHITNNSAHGNGTIAEKPKATLVNGKWVFSQNGPGNVQPANPEYTGPFYSLGEANVEPALPEGHPEAEKPEVKPDKKDNKKVEKKLPKTSAVK